MARIVNQSLVRNPECDLRVAAMKTEGKQQSEVTGILIIFFQKMLARGKLGLK